MVALVGGVERACDLTVNGSMRFVNMDVYTPLYVTGSVTAQDLLCLMDCNLIVGGSLTIGGLLMTELTDGGMLVVHGATSAGAWLEAWDRGEVALLQDLEGRRLRLSDSPYDGQAEAEDAADALSPGLLDDGTEDLSDRLWKAALEGRPPAAPRDPAPGRDRRQR